MTKCKTCNDKEATTGAGECRWCWRKEYTKKNHAHIFKVAHANYLRNRERRREKAKIWNDKNRERKITNQKAYLKATGYASDKTPKRRKMMRLRALTSMKYPILENQLCELCKCGHTKEEHGFNHYKYCKDRCVLFVPSTLSAPNSPQEKTNPTRLIGEKETEVKIAVSPEGTNIHSHKDPMQQEMKGLWDKDYSKRKDEK